MKFLCSFFILLCPLFSMADTYGNFSLGYDYFSQEVTGRDESRAKAKLSLISKHNLNKSVSVKLSPRYWYDGQAKAKGQQHFLDMEEAYIQWDKKSFSLKAGMVQLNWGVTESFDPAAVIHSYVFWDPLNLTALASAGVHGQWAWGDSQFEVVVIPDKRSSKLPEQGSRWLPSEVIQNKVETGDNVIILPNQPSFAYLPGRELNRANQWNAGMRFYDHWRGLDWALFFFDGASPTPRTGISLGVPTSIETLPDGRRLITIDSELGLQPIDFRQYTAGGTLVYNFDNIILRYAGSHQKILGQTVNPWQDSHVVGLEVSWLSSGRYTTIFEHSMIRRAQEGGGSLITSIAQLFDRSYLAALRIEWSDDWSSLVSLLFDDVYQDKIYQATLSGKIQDSLTLELSWLDIVPADRLSPLGSYNQNDRAQVLLTYFF